MFGYIGTRLKQIRKDLDLSQQVFTDKINSFVTLNYKKEELGELKFTQITISNFENELSISKKKLLVLMLFLHEYKRLNIMWLLLENNNNQPKYLNKIVVDKSITNKIEVIKEHQKSIIKELNDIDVVILNNNF